MFVPFSVLRGIDSLLLIPPQGIKNEELYQKLRQFIPELSLFNKDFPIVYPPPNIDYQQQLDEKAKIKLKKLDERLLNLLLQPGSSPKKIKWCLRRRGLILAKIHSDAFAGKYFDQTGLKELPKISIKEALRLYSQALLGMPSLLKAVMNGETLKMVKELKEKGVPIQFLIPEYDIIVPPKAIKELLGEEFLRYILLLSGYTHATIALNPYFPDKKI